MKLLKTGFILLFFISTFSTAAIIPVNLNGIIDGYDPVQDNSGNAHIVTGNPPELHLIGNSWKKLEGMFEIGVDSVITFQFKSNMIGEIQGFGFDTNNLLNYQGQNFFQLAGSQVFGNQDFKTYSNIGEWTTYTIAVGSYFTGTFSNIFFAADNDAEKNDVDSFFRFVNSSNASNTATVSAPDSLALAVLGVFLLLARVVRR